MNIIIYLKKITNYMATVFSHRSDMARTFQNKYLNYVPFKMNIYTLRLFQYKVKSKYPYYTYLTSL